MISMTVSVRQLEGPAVEALPVEIVERKGLGHPDTICDALAEEVSLALSRYYRDRFGLILHHNVDKILLCGGSARTAFGGGEVTAPIEIFLAGRATREFWGEQIPVDELAQGAVRDWLHRNLHTLDFEQHVRVHSHIRPGSADLVELYLRQQREGILLANDTSIGVGYAPLSPLESTVLHLEKHLNSPSFKDAHPAMGEDIKVMGVRQGESINLTVACALIGSYVANIEEYLHRKDEIRGIAEQIGRRYAGRRVKAEVNTADDPEHGSVYLTVTGTSAESGDDGEAGRGNRANGLITPYRPMTMESVAGKNPVTHVGKIYNIAAGLIAEALAAEVPEIDEVSTFLVSQIGRPINEPQIVDLRVRLKDHRRLEALRPRIESIAQEHLAALPDLADRFLSGEIAADRWPFREVPPAQAWQEMNQAELRRGLVAEIEADVKLTASLTGRKTFSSRVLRAMAKVPRHAFVPAPEQTLAYLNTALPIGHRQTISQPYIVALMTDLLAPKETDIVLEVGTGSGYQAAILATLVKHVYSIEIVEPLAAQAKTKLEQLGYANVSVRTGDGYAGWPEHAPFDGIIVTAAAPSVPQPLLDQLKPRGRMVIPVGKDVFGQDLMFIEKEADGRIKKKSLLPVAFVPLTGKH